jgi:tetratricopeptide (TPR) repeat protein
VEYDAELDPAFVGDTAGRGPDLALIEITGSDVPVLPGMGLGAVDRDSRAGEPVERCHAIGYPEFRKQETADGRGFRETADAVGQVPVLSGLAGGLLSIQVMNSPQPLPPAQVALADSPWAGMSGAPVVADGYLLAVVTEHAAREGSSSITATPLTALEHDPAHPGWGAGVANPGAWWSRLGVPDAAALQRLPATQEDPPVASVSRRFYGERLVTGVERFVDRDGLRSALRTLLSGQCRIISVTGHRGIGKSALVAKVLAEFETASRENESAGDIDAIVYLSMRPGMPAITLDRIYLAITELAGEPERGNLQRLWNNVARIDPFPALFEAFSARELIVVLDNLDNLQDTLAESRFPDIYGFLGSTCRTPYPVHVVTTSQLPLHLPAEMIGDVFVIDVEDGLGPGDAVALLRTLDPDGRAGLRDADENDLLAAARRLRGAPRGLELLAGDLRDPVLGIQDVLADDSSLDEILYQLISAGYASLDDAETSVVQVVAVAGEPLPRPAVAQLLPELPAQALGDAFRQLVVRRLLSFDKNTGKVSMHPLDTDYVIGQLLRSQADLKAGLHRRLADWYGTQRSNRAGWRTLADVRPQRLEFSHLLATGDRARALATIAQVAEFMARHGGIEALQAAALVANDDDPDGIRTDADWCRGFAEFFGGSLTEALSAFGSARQLITDAADGRAAELDYWIGAGLRHMGRAQQAVERLRSAVAATPQPTPRVRALFELGLSYCYLQDQASAGAVVTELEHIVGPDSPAIVRGQLHNMRALVMLVTPDYDGAIAEVDAGLNFYRVTQQQDNEGFLWNLRGLAQLGADQKENAIQDLTRGRDCAIEYGVLRLQGICWTNLAWALLRNGSPQDAADAAATGERLLTAQKTEEATAARLLRHALEAGAQDAEIFRGRLAEAVAGTLGNPDFYQPSDQVLAAVTANLSGSTK